MIKVMLTLLPLVFLATPANAVVCGTADDTSTIQAAIDAGGKVVLPAGDCRVTSLNITDRQGVTLEGQGVLTTRLIPIQSGKVILDLTGSSNITLRDFRLCGYCDLSVVSTIGILNAQSTLGYNSDVTGIERVRVDGKFSLAAWYVHGVASSYAYAAQFYNYQPNAITVIMTGNNFFGAASQFTTIDNGNKYPPSDWTLVQTEIHNFGNGWGLWIGGATSIRAYGGNISSSHPLVSLNAVTMSYGVQYPANIVMDGTTFYNDFAPRPACVLSGQTAAVSLRANDTASIPMTGC